MLVTVVNAQREAPVDVVRMRLLARRAVRRLRIRARGTFSITFIDSRRIKTLNRRFLQHNRITDVLSFRYDGELVVGEVLIAPRAAQRYAKTHGLSYTEELSRYIVHGLLHWLGHEDRTNAQQRAMRIRENRLLALCSRLRG